MAQPQSEFLFNMRDESPWTWSLLLVQNKLLTERTIINIKATLTHDVPHGTSALHPRCGMDLATRDRA
jgi:hypothetical protein